MSTPIRTNLLFDDHYNHRPGKLGSVSLAPTRAAPGQPVMVTATLNSAAPAGGLQLQLGYVWQSKFQAAAQNPDLEGSLPIRIVTQFTIAAGSVIGRIQFSAPVSPEPLVVLVGGSGGELAFAVLTITS